MKNGIGTKERLVKSLVQMGRVRHNGLFLLLFLLTASCSNKKAEIVEALKVAKKHVEDANASLQDVEDIRNNERKMFEARMKFKRTPVDSLIKYMTLGIHEKSQWEPVVDSLEMELKKY